MKKETYKGYLITYVAGYFWTLGQPFASIIRAKNEIDKITL